MIKVFSLGALAGVLICSYRVDGFVTRCTFAETCRSPALLIRRMGLYDTPLPPRPPPRKEPNRSSGDDDDDDDDDEFVIPEQRLFNMLPTGREANGLLPPLSRRLDSGIGCYFEPTDRKVKTLVEKTSCDVQDAAWALEACKGDITEAWTCISVARRLQLNNARKQMLMDADGDEYDEEDYEIEMEDAFLEQREQMKKERKKQDIKDLFSGGQGDQEWLPKSNPRPVEDEPWFTG